MSDGGPQLDEIRSLLAGGLQTEMLPRADAPEEREAVIRRLRTSAGDLTSKLVIAGFTLKPVEHGGFMQDCESCMYFKVHAKHCVLPELDVPVEPEWSCRVWRI